MNSYTSNKLDNLEEKDKFLERYNLSRVNNEETENVNRLITRKKFKSVIKNHPTNRSRDHTASLVNSTKYSKN